LYRYAAGDNDSWKDIVSHTSRDMLGEVVQEMHADWLTRMPYFHGVDRDGHPWEVDAEFKLELSLEMTIELVAPMEAVFKEDSPIDKLYVIQQGLVGCRSRVLSKARGGGGSQSLRLYICTGT
jgi:hypothetical protein